MRPVDIIAQACRAKLGHPMESVMSDTRAEAVQQSTLENAAAPHLPVSRILGYAAATPAATSPSR